MNDALGGTLADDGAAIAGWYGKLPSLGDFAARRLSDAFVAPWDAWLAERVGETQLALGDAWLSIYLTCPVWRFFAMPGAIAPTLGACWTGVVMASVDRVGRHFPLTIAASLQAAPSTGGEVAALWQWLSAIENVALAALDFDHSIERLDEQLAALPVPQPANAGTRAAMLDEPWIAQSAATLPDSLARTLAPLWQTEIQGMSLWTAAQTAPASDEPDDRDDRDDRAPRPITIWPAYGLPDTALFITLLRDCGS
ncbi:MULTISPECIES: type VI secretion system-associated protein TagF [Caballeronia]|jgi:type VI secretion system protein ImpM|uniref:type VI secretion system-associated protein TagF n=1 Tax=Caballeronia TaxID=1827195 RepID=UPI00158A7554|nr:MULTISPECIES: type VI secretion system-associated protein TagF [Caballeronia]MCG7403823.1 type VI secretion system-associated protein TagF [Caballeronia zhejiangensis]MCI1044713.1 type VI secretion system-associated protein TagF [Caballeronia zhejiangensis]